VDAMTVENPNVKSIWTTIERWCGDSPGRWKPSSN
jgi:hypothetical protein